MATLLDRSVKVWGRVFTANVLFFLIGKRLNLIGSILAFPLLSVAQSFTSDVGQTHEAGTDFILFLYTIYSFCYCLWKNVTNPECSCHWQRQIPPPKKNMNLFFSLVAFSFYSLCWQNVWGCRITRKVTSANSTWSFPILFSYEDDWFSFGVSCSFCFFPSGHFEYDIKSWGGFVVFPRLRRFTLLQDMQYLNLWHVLRASQFDKTSTRKSP